MRRLIRIALISAVVTVETIQAAALTVVGIAGKSNVDFRVAQTDAKLGSFLVLNPALTNLTVYVVFGNGCNVEHFRRSDLVVPLQSVRFTINGVMESLPRVWTRGSDCGTLTWSPPGPTYADSYLVDILGSWNVSAMNIAGLYSETVTVTAISVP